MTKKLAAILVLVVANGNSLLMAEQDLYVSMDNSIGRYTPTGTYYLQFASGIPAPGPVVFAPDGSGDAYVASEVDGKIYKISSTSVVTTFASGLSGPRYMAFDGTGNLFVASYDPAIKRITPAGTVSTFVTLLPASANGIEFDTSGNLYAAESTGTIVKISPAGAISLFASGFSWPEDLEFDRDGNLYASDFDLGVIAKFTPAGVRSTFASIANPMSIDFDINGNLFVSQYRSSISKVTTDGSISTFVSSVPSSRVRGITFSPVPGPSTLTPGDFDRNGVLTQTDLVDLLQSITDESAWKTSHNLSDDQLRAMGDVNGDGTFNNADIQALINKLINPSAGPRT